MTNFPEKCKTPASSALDLPAQSNKYPNLSGLVAPVKRTIPELLEESVAQQEPFKAFVEQGETEMEVSFSPPKAGKKQELNFKFRS